jgi:hypothetical protein
MFNPLRDDLMVQQQITNSWEHMVGVIMLNQTGRKAVNWFPRMSQDYLTWDGKDAEELFGIGKYGSRQL